MAELVLPSGAIKIIQSQQQLVGGAIAGGAAAVSPNDTDKNSELNILQQIKEVTLKSFKKTTEIAKTLIDTLTFEKSQQRIERDQAAEIAKEKKGGGKTDIDTTSVIGETKSKFEGAAFALGAVSTPVVVFAFLPKNAFLAKQR